MDVKTRSVLDAQGLDKLLRHLESSTYICVDLETTGLDDNERDARVVSASFSTDDTEGWVIPLSHPSGIWGNNWQYVLSCLARACEGKRVVAHNANFDLRWIYTHTKVDLAPYLYWDTLVSSYILNENESKSLKYRCQTELGIENWADVDVTRAEQADWFELAKYNARDTAYTLRLMAHHVRELKRFPSLLYLFRDLAMPAARSLIYVERNGLLPDLITIKERKAEAEELISTMEQKFRGLAEEAGLDPDEFNMNANAKFFQEFMKAMKFPVVEYSRKTKRPSWRRAVLEHLGREGIDLAHDILSYREATKAIGTFFDPWVQAIAEDGRVHPRFNHTNTVTGRLSSSSPNAQQIPRTLTDCWVAEDGHLFVALDYSQMELRCAAMIANDTDMIEAYRNGVDLHTLMASEITGKDIEDITPEERQGGKAGNFGFLFGMMPAKYVTYAKETYGVDVTIEEATKIREAFLNKWPGIALYHNRQREKVMREGFVENPFGRVRRLPEVWSDNEYKAGEAERKAINSPVQSFASDLMMLALTEMVKSLRPEEGRVVGTVHDSVLVEVAEKNFDQTLDKLFRILLTPQVERFGVRLTVPLAVEAKINTSWGGPNSRYIERTSGQ